MTSKLKHPLRPQFNKPPIDYAGWATFCAIVVIIGLLVYACGAPVR